MGLLALIAVAGLAREPEAPSPDPGGGHVGVGEQDADHRPHHPPNIVAVRLVSALVGVDDGPVGLWGLGAYWERTVVPEWLELEVAATALGGADEAVLALDAFAKVPFDLGRGFELHAGVGPIVQLVWAHDEEEGPLVEPGGIATVDLYAWTTPTLGLVFELDGAVLDGEHGAVGEAELASGVAVRF